MKRLKRLEFLLFCLPGIFLMTGCEGLNFTMRENNQQLVIFAASSLTDSFNELAQVFEAQHKGVEILLNFGGSSQLAVQLQEGATADLFASANADWIEAVVASGQIEPDTPRRFAQNRLTLIVPKDNPAGVQSWEELGKPGIQLVLAAKGVPVRTYGDAVVAMMPDAFQEQFYANVVSEESNVRQAATKVALGEADAGIVYVSDITPDLASQVQQIEIPQLESETAVYYIAPLLNTPHPQLAAKFIDFTRSEDGQAILLRWGFELPDYD